MKPVPIIIIFVFALLMMIGIFLDEPSRVLNLSTQVCLSCIGIG